MAMGFREEEEEEAKINKRKKFSINDTVEVRSEEDGFQGSWHPGTVIAFQSYGWGVRYVVKYSHFLVDDGFDHLVDHVDVSDLADENDCSMVKLCNYRGHIRPLPSLLKFGTWDLPYGMCVDVCYNDCWWEGVIFDHEEGSNERQIFFPDLGDEMMTCIDAIRITQDWNNVTGTWQNRGTWLFLEVIEQFEKEHFVPVSVKQLWYDIREKNNSQKLVEWVSTDKDMWKVLVSEAVDDKLKVVMNHFFQELDLPENAQGLLESAKPFNDVNAYPEAVLVQNHAMVSVENMSNSNMSYPNSSSVDSIQERSNVQQLASLSSDNRSHMHLLTESNVSCHEKGVCVLPQVLWVLPSNQDGISVTNSTTNEEDFSSSNANKNNERYSSSMCSKSSWLPAGPDLVPGAALCPNAVLNYAYMGKKRPQSSMLVDIRKHLLYLSWKIEYSKQRNVIRLRYISPNGDCYYSLYKVCLYLIKRHPDILSSACQDDDTNLFNSPGNLSSLLIEQSPENQNSVVSSYSDVVAVEPEYCPEAAVDWFKFGFEERLGTKNRKEDIQRMTLRAKKHLLAVGWHFNYVIHNGRCELRYKSPRGRVYNSLRMACKDAIERETVSNIFKGQSAREKLSSSRRETELQKLENCSHFSCKSKLRKTTVPQKFKLGGTRKIQKKRKERLHLSFCLHQQEANLDGQNFLQKMRKGMKIRDLFKLKNGRTGTWPTHVLRSHKRVQQVVVPNPSHQKPRTILSWLIDNNVVLPREKVYYCSRKGRHPIAEGRITRDGIKCKCCGKVYTLSNFELHVSGKNGRPAASIFLEDGRSLLDCQMQIIHDEMGKFAVESPERLKGRCHQGENDHICSVCHYGGELILCDQCPSSFHKSCLGMEDIPDGDWFCPSCCCKICGQNKLKSDTLHSMDDNCIVTCTQCEHKYHTGCLRIKGEDSIKFLPKENWFCSKKCEAIFLGLHELVGKPILVGLNNLTWTLLKSIQSDSRKLDAPDIDALTENYSKLNIALEVMHECFEPVEEPHTKRDLLKDVIFSKESELNRLNFRGFYTVLLQKDDELITVATVRVYGEKVAEIPLVGTRFQYRRLGMCRILMNVLEKKLMELGVERLVLPAVPSVLHTWTGSFGFSKMTHSERLQFLDHTFLDFQDTVMCQKLLMKIPSAESSPSTEVPDRLQNDASGSGDTTNLDGSSAVSDVFQADQTEGGIVEQRQVDVAASNSSSGSEGPIHQVLMVNTTDSHCEHHAGKISLDCSVEDSIFKKERKDIGNGSNTLKIGRRYGNVDLKCYRRKFFPSGN